MSSKIIKGINKDTIIIAFAGGAIKNVVKFEFVNFLSKHYPELEKHFYIDLYAAWYHKGIGGISSDIDTTTNYLKEQIKDFKQVIFIGASSGGYAAILFGSLLNIDTVIAFKPQTQIPSNNLKNIVNDKTNYYLFADDCKDALHNISHCHNINIGKNVIINNEHEVDLKKMRDSGVLEKIFKNIVK